MLSIIIFVCSLLLAGFATGSAIPHEPFVEKRGGACTSSDFVSQVPVGGTGTGFCASRWGSSYLPITNITFWDDGNYVTGVQVIYSDGQKGAVIGYQAAARESTIGVEYGLNNGFTHCNLYGGETDGSVVRHIYMKNSANQTLNSGEPLSDNPNEYIQPVGTGILFGIQGTTGPNGHLTSIGFLFLGSAIKEIEINNVQFAQGIIGSSQGIAPTALATGHYYNNQTSGPVQWQFNNQIAMMASYAFAQAYTSTFTIMEAIGFTFGVNIMIIMASTTSTTTFVWTTTSTTTTTATFTESVQVQYNAQGDLNPGQGVDCTALYGQGAGTFPYTSTVTITLANGHQYSFPESGELTLSTVSQAQVEVTQDNNP